ncbi:hypothetical protein [Streptomyces sp. NPDC005970]|uniref:hypothetical protein n=1 Tax=Streptomyces sp. NPDC005970 TaxID=3156723 RepID=UPI0033DFBAF7
MTVPAPDYQQRPDVEIDPLVHVRDREVEHDLTGRRSNRREGPSPSADPMTTSSKACSPAHPETRCFTTWPSTSE